jgi:threonine/homoserine/homoserine lactone efflux protein
VTVASSVASFALVAGLLTITPGLDTALVLRTALTTGRARAFATALGVGTGALSWGIAAAAGVSALLVASHLAYTVLRMVGAAYLIWLGARMLWQTRRPPPAVSSGVPERPVGGVGRAWARGLGTNLLNPKVGAFYVAMLPQFLPAHVAHLEMGLLLAGVHDVETIAWFTLVIGAAHLVRGWLDRPVVHRVIDRITGTVLIGFGLKLALTEH